MFKARTPLQKGKGKRRKGKTKKKKKERRSIPDSDEGLGGAKLEVLRDDVDADGPLLAVSRHVDVEARFPIAVERDRRNQRRPDRLHALSQRHACAARSVGSAGAAVRRPLLALASCRTAPI
eukprot:3142424-Rhodomonas_salina.1